MSLRRSSPCPMPCLRQISTPVTGVDDGIRGLMDDMLETMYDGAGHRACRHPGGGRKRVIVVDVAKRERAKAKMPRQS